MALDVHRIEQSLARNARQYLHTRNSELETALASDLEWLLEYHWHAQGHLKWCWFDGLVEWSFRVRKSHRLDVRGAMVWAETGNNTRQWIELFAADLRVSPDEDELAGYILRFGRKGMEERKIPYGRQQELLKELEQAGQWTWALVFTKSDLQV